MNIQSRNLLPVGNNGIFKVAGTSLSVSLLEDDDEDGEVLWDS